MKTGVLVHGCHLQVKNWEEIVWGKPPDLLGRAPKGVLVALEEKAEIMVFGTGASEKDGKKEAEYTRDYLVEHFYKLAEFSAFRDIDLIKTKIKIEGIIITEAGSLSTIQEVEYAKEIFREVGIDKVVLVSGPTHIFRCLRDALAVMKGFDDISARPKPNRLGGCEGCDNTRAAS